MLAIYEAGLFYLRTRFFISKFKFKGTIVWDSTEMPHLSSVRPSDPGGLGVSLGKAVAMTRKAKQLQCLWF